MTDIHIIQELTNLASNLTIGGIVLTIGAIMGLVFLFIMVKGLDEAFEQEEAYKLFSGQRESIKYKGKIYTQENLEELHGKI